MKYALITGASRGIGAAAALEFASRGWGVAVNYSAGEEDALRVAEQVRAYNVPAMTVRADVSDRGQVVKMVDSVLDNFCQLDILVCNAGISEVGLVSQIDEAGWRRIFGVNVDGMHYCCQAVLPHFIHRKAGSIVTVSSMWGQVGASCEVAYSATKGAVIAYTKALAKEVGPSGIRVNCVAPGVIATGMNAHLSREELAALADETPLGRLGTPEEVARAIAFLAGEEASFLTGQVVSPNGGLVI
ncbi:MAG: 3-oxoacyl-ACP reductase FabG [Oscillospiraceae bacterium]|nr:3-oxoacyl-ACP reductase FabG [Oscillospiraceae bacterium]